MSPLMHEFAVWGEAHRKCTSGQLEERAPQIAETVASLTNKARAMLAKGDALALVYAVILENDDVIVVPFDGFPSAADDPVGHADAIAYANWGLRRHMAAQRIQPKAAMLFIEAWASDSTWLAPSADPNRRDVVLLAVSTRDWSGAAVAPLTRRRPSRGGKARALLGKFEWGEPRPLELLDGLFASVLPE
jgi:hypothetical protein